MQYPLSGWTVQLTCGWPTGSVNYMMTSIIYGTLNWTRRDMDVQYIVQHSAGMHGYICRIPMKAVDATVNLTIIKYLLLFYNLCGTSLASDDEHTTFLKLGAQGIVPNCLNLHTKRGGEDKEKG